MGSFLPTSQTGQSQAGLQTRQELGLPPRSSYMPEGFVPSPSEIQAIGLPPVRAGTQKQIKKAKRQENLRQRIETREAKGKSTAKQDRKLKKAGG